MEAEKEKNSIVKKVGRAGVVGALTGLVFGGSTLVTGASAMSMAATAETLKEIRGKEDIWNLAAAGSAATLTAGMFFGPRPEAYVPLAVVGAILGGTLHVLYYD